MRCPRKIKKWVKDGRKEKNCTGQRFVNGSWRTCIEVVVVDGKEEKRDAHIYRQKRFSLVFLFLASNYRSPSSKRWDDGGASDVNPIQRLSPFPILPDCWLWRPQQSFFLSEPRSEGNDGPNPPGVYIYISIYPYCSVIFVMCAHNKKERWRPKRQWRSRLQTLLISPYATEPEPDVYFLLMMSRLHSKRPFTFREAGKYNNI